MLQELEKISFIKKNVNALNTFTFKEKRPTNGLFLLELIKNNNLNLLEFINKYSNIYENGSKGYLYEKIGSILFITNSSPYFDRKNYTPYRGNINLPSTLSNIFNLGLFLDELKIFSKNEGGSSDITFYDKTNDKWIFISSKFFEDDSKKSIKSYEVQDILANINVHSNKYKKYEIWLLINNKEKVLQVIKSSQSTNSYIKNNILKIIGINDMNQYYKILHKSLQDIQLINREQVSKYFDNEKVNLNLRLHQEYFIDVTLEKIKKGEKMFLWGWKCRSGKTFGTVGLFHQMTKKNKFNALIITPVPKETKHEWLNTILKFRGIDESVRVVVIKNGIQFKPTQF